MRKIDSLLTENGLALLEFPNTRSLSYVYKRLRKNWGLQRGKYPPDWRPGHCNEFCRRTFRYLLRETGFELLIWQTYSKRPVMNAVYRMIPIASKARALVRKRARAANHSPVARNSGRCPRLASETTSSRNSLG